MNFPSNWTIEKKSSREYYIHDSNFSGYNHLKNVALVRDFNGSLSVQVYQGKWYNSIDFIPMDSESDMIKFILKYRKDKFGI